MHDRAETRRRRIAIIIFGVLTLIFIVISGASFAQERQLPDPTAIRFMGQTAVDGKRVFQAYNCMGCHTLVGNGAYFAPDLTTVYSSGGSAWLMAFLINLQVWPDKTMVDPWVGRLVQTGEADAPTLEAYYQKFDGAASDVVDRGGWGIVMPNLHLSESDAAALVAYLKYTSQLNTQGWPPVPQANADLVSQVQQQLHSKFGGPRPTPTSQP
jgi:hypothetical protein